MILLTYAPPENPATHEPAAHSRQGVSQHMGRGGLEDEMVKEIRLTQGFVAIIDDEDERSVAFHKWYAAKPGGSKKFYPHTNLPCAASRSGRAPLTMQRFIANPPSGMEVDHKDGDTMNNLRSNLRVCTPAQNRCNKEKVPGSSMFKGVTFDRKRGKWKAQISINNWNTFIGRFDVEEDAARAYDVEAIKNYGEFARVNFPEAS